jgi:DNA polymerase-3 subunit beta
MSSGTATVRELSTALGCTAMSLRTRSLTLDPTKVHIGDTPSTVAFDRGYLADAVRSFGDADVQLTVGERDAVRLAAVHGPDAVVLLMPVRLDAHAA